MKFMMVIIVCFGGGVCDAVFEPSKYNTYGECQLVARETAMYMKESFPNSVGEIHCWPEKEMEDYKKFLQDGNVPIVEYPEESTPA